MTPRLPWGPLESLVDARLFRADRSSSDKNRAELLGTNRTQILRWRRYGILPDRAERCAERLGFIGYEVWPELLTDAIAAEERVCADCPTRVLPDKRNPHQRFCSHNCQKRSQMRARYRSIPDEVRAPVRGAYRRKAA